MSDTSCNSSIEQTSDTPSRRNIKNGQNKVVGRVSREMVKRKQNNVSATTKGFINFEVDEATVKLTTVSNSYVRLKT